MIRVPRGCNRSFGRHQRAGPPQPATSTMAVGRRPTAAGIPRWPERRVDVVLRSTFDAGMDGCGELHRIVPDLRVADPHHVRCREAKRVARWQGRWSFLLGLQAPDGTRHSDASKRLTRARQRSKMAGGSRPAGRCEERVPGRPVARDAGLSDPPASQADRSTHPVLLGSGSPSDVASLVMESAPASAWRLASAILNRRWYWSIEGQERAAPAMGTPPCRLHRAVRAPDP